MIQIRKKMPLGGVKMVVGGGGQDKGTYPEGDDQQSGGGDAEGIAATGNGPSQAGDSPAENGDCGNGGGGEQGAEQDVNTTRSDGGSNKGVAGMRSRTYKDDDTVWNGGFDDGSDQDRGYSTSGANESANSRAEHEAGYQEESKSSIESTSQGRAADTGRNQSQIKLADKKDVT